MNQVVPINAANARLPQTYENAKTALANCASLDECKDWADKAAALASYAKQANDPQLMNMATRIRHRAINREGELLKQFDARPDNAKQRDAAVPLISQREVAESAGISERQRKTAVRIANIPTAEFEALVESDNPPTISQLAQMGIKRPLIDLKGRDPREFNRSLHFIAEIEEYAKAITNADLALLLPALTPPEAERVRQSIAKIDAVHDRIITRI